jgi:hypothetical protein
MICCKECLDLLCDFLEGSLPEETAKSLEEHFQDCPPCIAFLNTYKSTSKICKDSLGTIEIPDAVKLKLQEFIKENTRNQ